MEVVIWLDVNANRIAGFGPASNESACSPFARGAIHCVANDCDRCVDFIRELGLAAGDGIEAWLERSERGGELVGGLYGVAFGRVFCGESMFSRADNASKVALAWLVALMRRAGYRLLDCQFMTGHLGSMGAIELPQARYLELVAAARGAPAMTLPQAYASVLAAGAGAAGAGLAEGDGDAAGAVLPEERPEGDATGASSPGKLIAQSFTQTS